MDAALATLESAPDELLAGRTERLTALAERTRPRVEDALAAAPAASSSAKPPRAPAILRPRDEMQAAELIETDLARYLGPQGALAFFKFTNPDGTPKSGDAPVPNMDQVLRAFNTETLAAARKGMENDPRLTLGPDYGDPQLNFVAMILAMNATQGRTPQTVDAYVNPVFGSINSGRLEGKPILGYRPSLMDGARNPKPYSHDNPRLPWAKRLAARQTFLKGKPFKGTDRQAYADLMGVGLVKQEPVDSQAYTIFDADSALTSSQVPGGRFYGDRPRFDALVPRVVGGCVRFRSVLEGDVLR